MLSGLPPFSSKEGAKALFQKIMSEKVKMPSGSSAAACKLLKGLLNRNVLARFGTSRTTMFEVGGVAGLKQQDFFSHLSWDRLERKDVEPPATFVVDNDNDARYFHDEFTTMTLPRSVVDMSSERFLPRRVQSDAFRGFSFVHDDFLVPPRDEDEEKSYWEAAEEDGESASECASSKMGDEVLLVEVEPPKKKRQPRKRKKNAVTTADAMESRTANTTPLGSAVHTPESSEVAGIVGHHESVNVAEAEKGIQKLFLSAEVETIETKPLVPTVAKANVQSLSLQAPLPAPRSIANETWQDIGKEKGKKQKSRDKKSTPIAASARPSQSAPTVSNATFTGHSSPNRSIPTRQAHQPSLSAPGRGHAPNKQESLQPRRPPPPSSSGSSDWRQHSIRVSPRIAKATSPPKLQPEAIVWPSLSSEQPQQQASPADQTKHLSGAWAKRAVQR